MNTSHETSRLPVAAKIVERRPLSSDTSLFRVRLEGETPLPFLPGQFVQLSVPAGGEAPISLASIPCGETILDLCVRRVGHVTSMLHELSTGAPLAVRGPFGNGYPVHEWKGRNLLLVAGGLGMAPLRSLLHYLLRQRDRFGDITLMYGAREPSAILFKEELAELSGRRDLHVFLTVDFATEDTPSGLTCRTGLLPALLEGVKFTTVNTVAAVCGPPPLYHCVVPELVAFGIPPEAIHLSLERRMKCGIGLCCHCAVGEFFCCTDGPVFTYSRLRHVEGAL